MSVLEGIVLQKSKIAQPKNLAKVDFWTSLRLRDLSTLLGRSVVDFGQFGSLNVAAHKTGQRLQEFSFVTPKKTFATISPRA
jgi:hypothetical protein